MDNQDIDRESDKVADIMNHAASPEAAAALSQALIPMNHEGYKDFLQAVQSKSESEDGGYPRNVLRIDGNNVHLNSTADLEPDFVIVMPGQTLSSISRSDIAEYAPAGTPITPQGVKDCVNEYAKVNHLEDPNKIIAGTALHVPGVLEQAMDSFLKHEIHYQH